MTHQPPHPWTDRLSDYLDDELDPDERVALESHLLDCGPCRSDLDALRGVIARAATLADVAPETARTDLWPGILERIGGRTASTARESRRFAFTVPQLIAASLALMLLSGGMVWLARLGGPRTDFPTTVAVTPANFTGDTYDEAIADLQQTLDAGRAKLDAQTVRVLEANLNTIDQAIGQCREALAADPANVYLNTYLAEARGRKLEMLRRAAAIVEKSS
ncbi:MAG: zf-HC2 domain-containing protein [Vicinamibacterales bacterium]